MKNLLLIAAIALTGTQVFASKARLTALSSSAHLSDIRDTLTNPSKMMGYGDWLTFEMGRTATAVSTTLDPKAEGGFTRAMGESRFGFYLGNTPTWLTEFRTSAYTAAENPINLFYGAKAGDLAWGVGLLYSNSDKKTSKTKQTATGLQAGVTAAAWDAYVNLGLTNTFKDDTTSATVDFKGTNAIEVGGTFAMDTITFHADVKMNGGKETQNNADTKDHKKTEYTVGAVNSMKAEGSDFFYGVKITQTEQKEDIGNTKTTTMKMPVHFGIEADATSWMVLRASLSQNFLLGSTKTETNGTGDANTIANDTTVAGGVGLKFGKLTLDGTLEAASSNTAALNGNALLANAALTYMF